ncbi:hypothetical protein VTJ83DRAFT_878 [Remersonia thermophila]|uniref:Peroxin 11C n=1 Tax=Remersonia thermophila TaxID=72144 RepID=A0ABR4DMJ2_9PEZI
MADSSSSSGVDPITLLDAEPVPETPSTASPAPEPTPETTTAATTTAAAAAAAPAAPVPAPTPAARRLPTISALFSAAASSPSNLDAFLTRLNKCLSTPAGIDTVLLFLCYTSKFAGAWLERLSQSALRRSAREWIALVAALPRGTTVVFSSATASAAEGGKAAVPAAAARALVLSKRLAALSSLLSEARTILRLWALLPMYFWAKGVVKNTKAAFASPAKDGEKTAAAAAAPPRPGKLELLVEWARLVLCVVFQGLENGAYLSSRGVLGWTPQQQGLAYRWSSRLWATYIGIELGRYAAERLGGDPKAVGTAEARAEWTKKTLRQLAWAPLTIHWGSEKALFGEATVGLLASVPGIIQLRDLWASTA